MEHKEGGNSSVVISMVLLVTHPLLCLNVLQDFFFLCSCPSSKWGEMQRESRDCSCRKNSCPFMSKCEQPISSVCRVLLSKKSRGEKAKGEAIRCCFSWITSILLVQNSSRYLGAFLIIFFLLASRIDDLTEVRIFASLFTFFLRPLLWQRRLCFM